MLIRYIPTKRSIFFLLTTLFALGLFVTLLSPAISPLSFNFHFSEDWSEGFQHPLTGWDHILVMVAVGIWAAQIRGQALWVLPIVFVGVMSFGGLIGAASFMIPGAEVVILLSCLVISALIVRGLRFSTPVNIIIISLFAFSWLRTWAGNIRIRQSCFLYCRFYAGHVTAAWHWYIDFQAYCTSGYLLYQYKHSCPGKNQHTNTTKPDLKIDQLAHVVLDEVKVTGRADKLTGIADSASQGKVGQDQIQYRPMIRPGEILETVPGLIATQHSGEGKANQFFCAVSIWIMAPIF